MELGRAKVVFHSLLISFRASDRDVPSRLSSVAEFLHFITENASDNTMDTQIDSNL